MSQSLARGLEILLRLGSEGDTLDELAADLGVHKTTVLRLLRTLERERFVRHDASHRYYLGSRLFALASESLRHLDIRERARPHLRDLSRRVGGQTVHLAAFENDAVVYIDKVESIHAIRMYSRIGLTAAIHCTAVGKILAGALPARQQADLIDGLDLHPFTPRTITSPDELLRELETVHRQGWAMDRAEHEDFINCIGAPVHDAEGRVVAAVSVSVPDVILGPDEVQGLLPEILEATAAIDSAAAQPGPAPAPRRMRGANGRSASSIPAKESS